MRRNFIRDQPLQFLVHFPSDHMMMMCLPMVLFVACAPLVAGHGTLTKPASRNYLVNMGLTHPGEGQCHLSSSNHMNMNGCQGGVGPIDLQGACYSKCGHDLFSSSEACVTCKSAFYQTTEQRSGFQPEPRLGVCGDLQDRQSFSRPGNTDCNGLDCVTEALAKPFDSVQVDSTDNSFEVQVHLTAHHWGWAEFRLCREGGRGANGLGLTQECFNQDVLRFDAADAQERYAGQMGGEIEDPSDYINSNPSKRCDGPGAALKLEAPQIWSPPGSCCYAGGDCGNSNTSRTQNVRFMFPGPQAGPVYTIRVVLPAGLSCTQAAPCALQWTYMTGNSWDSYPEVFRNCADFYTAGAGSTQTVATPVPTSGATQAATPEPEPEAEPATPVPATPAPATPATGGNTVAPGSVICDNGAGSCKSQCSHACSNAVATNQCWGTPRYIHCKCSDGTTHSIPGCECMNSQCPESPQSTPATPAPAVATPVPTSGATQAATPAPTSAPATPAPATPAPATGGGGGGSTGCCSDSTCEQVWGSWAQESQNNCANSGGTWCVTCGVTLSQTEVGKVNIHRFRGARGSSMIEEDAELGTHDGPLLETGESKDEL